MCYFACVNNLQYNMKYHILFGETYLEVEKCPLIDNVKDNRITMVLNLIDTLYSCYLD